MESFTLTIDLSNLSTKFLKGSLIKDNNTYYYTDPARQTVESCKQIEEETATFAFNRIHLEADLISINNDIQGQLPLFFFIEKGIFYCSNSFWDLVDLKRVLSSVVPNNKVLECFRYLTRNVFIEQTFFEGIYWMPPAFECCISLHNLSWSFRDPLISSVERVTSLSNVIDELVSIIEQSVCELPSVEVWFGNSGGLDSRLIPAALKKFRPELDIFGFLVSDGRSKFTSTQKSSNKVAELFQIPCADYRMDASQFAQGLARDIEVNPFGPCDMHKIFIDEKLNDKLVMNAGNGYLVSNDNELWKQYGLQDDGVFQYFVRMIAKSKNIEKNRLYYEVFMSHIEGIDGLDKFSTFRLFHQLILNRVSPMGGFESMSYAGSFQYFYNSKIARFSTRFDEKLFYHRSIPQGLANALDPRLLKIPDQSGVVNYNNRTHRMIQKVIVKILGNGLDYNGLVDTAGFERFYGGTISTERKIAKFQFLADEMKLKAILERVVD